MKSTGVRARGKWYGRNWVRPDLRLALYLRDGMACMWCGEGLESGVTLTLDHIIPHSQGGTNAPGNLITCCHKCNSVRQARSIEVFSEDVAAYVNEGATASDIQAAITKSLSMDIKPFRAEAKAIIARRPAWKDALAEAAK